VAVRHSAPFAHGPDEHTVFHAATAAYCERHFDEEGFNPLNGGLMDCVVGELLGHSFHDESIPVATSRRRHPPGPDFEALLRLLDAMETAYGAEFDDSELGNSASSSTSTTTSLPSGWPRRKTRTAPEPITPSTESSCNRENRLPFLGPGCLPSRAALVEFLPGFEWRPVGQSATER